MLLNNSQSLRIRLIRCIAVVLILLTHILQEYKIGLSGYTNIGVQMFLVISGFLFGQYSTISWKKWTLRRIFRIIPSYYIILLATAIAYLLVLHKNIADTEFLLHFTTLHFLFFPNYPIWGGHLWYITAIVLCYLISPILFSTRMLKRNVLLFLYLVVVPLFLTILFHKTPMPYRLCGDIYCFIAGFLGARHFKQKIPGYFTALTIIITLLIIAFHYTSAQNNYWNINILRKVFSLMGPWERCISGISLCAFLYLPLFNIVKNSVMVNFIDKYSYQIYLSHKNFILGPLSLLYLSDYLSLNILVAIIATLVCAMIVAKLANIIKSRAEVLTRISPNNLLQRSGKDQ